MESTSSKWSISQRLIRISFEGNRDGARELSDDEVLWARPPAPRTDKNYPIVPYTIHQEAYVTKIGYEMNDRWSWNFLTPYIVQETDHIANTARGAIPADFGNFIIRSEGVGDLTLSPSYLAWENEDMSLTLYNGLSMPVGAIDEKVICPLPGMRTSFRTRCNWARASSIICRMLPGHMRVPSDRMACGAKRFGSRL